MSDPGNIRLTKADREILKRIAEGWRPLRPQIPHGIRLERRGLLRLDWGPEDTPDAERMVWYLTDRARKVLEADELNTTGWDLIMSIRGGHPEKCDFCEQLYGEDRYPVPEEGGVWACSECEARWKANGECRMI